MTGDQGDRRTDGGGAARDDAPPPDEREGIPPEEVEPDPTPPADADADDDGRADPEEFFVPRDEDGNVAHVETMVQGYGEAVVKPMVYGEVERYLGDAGQVANATPDTVAEILRNHVVDPDLDEFARENFREFVESNRRGDDAPRGVWFTEAVVREQMNPYAPQALLMAILRESGMDVTVGVDESGSATIEFGDEGN